MKKKVKNKKVICMVTFYHEGEYGDNNIDIFIPNEFIEVDNLAQTIKEVVQDAVMEKSERVYH